MGLRNHLSTILELRSNRRVSREQLRAKQLAKFRRLVRYANEHSPYYARLIRQRGIDPARCVPEEFPVLTKDAFIANFDDLVTDRSITSAKIRRFLERSRDCGTLLDGKYLVVHTSGTSGTVAYYIYTPEEWDRGHLHYLRINRLGFRRRLAHVAAMNGHFHGAVMSRRAERGVNRWLFNVRRYDINSPTREIVDGLNRFQPHVVSGYGGALKILSHFQKSGELSISPQQMYYGGEPLAPDDRREISDVFGAPVTSVYATSEHLIMGASVPGTDTMRMFEDYLIYHFADDHLQVTNLFNYSIPMIRYRMEDVLTPVGIQTRSHPFTLVKDLVGRNEQMLRFVNRHGRRDFIHPIVIAEFFVSHLLAFQVVLVDETRFVFRARLDPALDDAGRARTLGRIRAKLEAILAQKDMENVAFEVREVEQLGVDPRTGKFRLIEQAERGHAERDHAEREPAWPPRAASEVVGKAR